MEARTGDVSALPRNKRKMQSASGSAASFSMQDFAANDRIVWRNENNRLRHGIVQAVQSDKLLVLESFPNGLPKNPGIYDNSFYMTNDDDFEAVPLTTVVRKQNL
jgi:hypothetical protein